MQICSCTSALSVNTNLNAGTTMGDVSVPATLSVTGVIAVPTSFIQYGVLPHCVSVRYTGDIPH